MIELRLVSTLFFKKEASQARATSAPTSPVHLLSTSVTPTATHATTTCTSTPTSSVQPLSSPVTHRARHDTATSTSTPILSVQPLVTTTSTPTSSHATAGTSTISMSDLCHTFHNNNNTESTPKSSVAGTEEAIRTLYTNEMNDDNNKPSDSEDDNENDENQNEYDDDDDDDVDKIDTDDSESDESDALEAMFSDLVVKHITHRRTSEMSFKSSIVSLGILAKDENKSKEMTDILKHLHQYVPQTKYSQTHVVSSKILKVAKAKMHRILFGSVSCLRLMLGLLSKLKVILKALHQGWRGLF
uniref:Uncharacterized protein n=1 Tax=Amphimedon queenslandica TaxID=400682 RepID=A0A1X7UX73_AMPQE